MKDGPQSSSRNFPHKYLASVFLSLGFLVIWSGVLAGVLISQTLELNKNVKKSVSLYDFHESASLAAFALGDELVATVDWLLNKTKDDRHGLIVKEEQAKTNEFLKRLEDLELDAVNAKVFQIRKSIMRSRSPEEAIELYFQLNEELMQKCLSIHQPQFEMPSSSLAFILFVQGAIKKFDEISLGTLYLKSKDRFSSVLKTKYLTSHVESDELIKTSLQFVPKARAAWWESQYDHPLYSHIRDSIFDIKKQEKKFDGLNKKNLMRLHSKYVKNQVKVLKETRVELNNIFDNRMNHTKKQSKNKLSFHLSLAFAAISAIVFSIIVIGCSLREFGSTGESNANFLMQKALKRSGTSLIVQVDEKNSLPNTFLCSSEITDPTITSLSGRKSLIS